MRKIITHFVFISIVFCLLSADNIFANGSHDHIHSEKSFKNHHWEAPPEEAKRPNPIPNSLESIQRGKTLFSNYCVICHGKDAKTPLLPIYPPLAGQNADYTFNQMKDIKSGARNNGQTAAMKGIMHLVSEDEMRILADWLATLK